MKKGLPDNWRDEPDWLIDAANEVNRTAFFAIAKAGHEVLPDPARTLLAYALLCVINATDEDVDYLSDLIDETAEAMKQALPVMRRSERERML